MRRDVGRDVGVQVVIAMGEDTEDDVGICIQIGKDLGFFLWFFKFAGALDLWGDLASEKADELVDELAGDVQDKCRQVVIESKQ